MKYLPAIAALLILAALSIQPPQSLAQDGALPDVAAHVLLQPALSPDGKTLAFVYDGDIWSVESKGGTARRLTITEDNDGDPVFSPDGKWLAFRSRRYGSDDVFVMPARGGVAKRLTFADAGDTPECWLPDGSGLIFSSYRRQDSRDLWIVRLTGGEPWPITGGGFGVHEYNATISPDGKHIAYTNSGYDGARRRGYYGTADHDIWLCDFDGVTTSNHRCLTDNRSHDDSPVFISNDAVAYVTFADGKTSSSRIGKLTAMDLEGKTLTGWGGDTRLDPRHLTVGGGMIAFATGNYGGWQLHVSPLGQRPPTKIHTPEITLGSDVRRAEVDTKTLTSAEEYAVSPDGKKIAFIAGGDVYVMPADEDGVPYRLTDTVQKEMSISWAPDSTKLARINQAGGNLQMTDLSALGEGKSGEWYFKNPSDGRDRLSHPVFAPDGELWVVDLEGYIVPKADFDESGIKKETKGREVKGNFHGASLWGGDVFSFSPDGRWIVYDQPNELYDDVVMVADTTTGETHAMSHLFGDCSDASFSRDGKRVVFINNQEGSYDVYSVELAPEPPTFKEDKLEKLFKKEAKKDDAKEVKKDGEEKAQPKKPAKKKIEVKIDFDGIRDRAKRITSLDGNERNPIALSDGKTYLFIGASQGQTNLWKLTLDPDKGPNLKQLTQSKTRKGGLSLSADEKTVWWLDNGHITSMPVGGGKTTTYNFRVEQRRNRAELRKAGFDQAVWVMNDYYYDDHHHGQNFRAIAKRYRKALDAVSTGDEYGALMNDLWGEFNSSHQGFYAADSRSDGERESTGCLGLLFDSVRLSKGRFQVTEVVKDGPCDLPEGKPKPGAVLTAVNGHTLVAGDNLSALLTGTIGKKTTLTWTASETTSSTWDQSVKPVSRRTTYNLYYERWVRAQRAMVDRLSKGRLGYVHIKAMDGPSLDHFKHELGDAMLGKEGVVIDVRYNGGGYTAVDVLDILYKKTWLRRQYGGMKEVSENIYRSIALEKPSCLLINQASFSNAEIMAEGFKRLGIGKVVGVDTAGGCIGTGAYNLLDGSRMRLPSTGAYTVDGEDLELSGRKPDIYIENNPNDLDKGIDHQTEAAVKALLKQLGKK